MDTNEMKSFQPLSAVSHIETWTSEFSSFFFFYFLGKIRMYCNHGRENDKMHGYVWNSNSLGIWHQKIRKWKFWCLMIQAFTIYFNHIYELPLSWDRPIFHCLENKKRRLYFKFACGYMECSWNKRCILFPCNSRLTVY